MIRSPHATLANNCVASVALVVWAATVAAGASARAEVHPSGPLDTAVLIATHYRVEPNLLYLSAGGWNGKLDLYLPRRPRDPMPVALLFHGGGWVSGDKDEIALDVLPYLAMGFAVANVDYRLARVATAPAAVEDSRCALRWVVRHAKQYGLDVDRLILVGSSAGAHLALMAALAPASAGFDGLCPGDEPLKVAAVINFFGVIDVGELLAPPSARDFAVGWIGNVPDRAALAQRVSPITYVHNGAPPIFTAHGDADPVVPFAQARRLHEALDRAGVPNQLFPLHHGGHGQFDGTDVLLVNRALREFLLKHGILRKGQSELLQ
ncbi:MAG TPA: alpha/beta hydrolase [Polyangia bacterium]|nr:alpha/beta hydrolase [Polyangia bacterium]